MNNKNAKAASTNSYIICLIHKQVLMQIIKNIQNRIYEIRGERVMLDRDLAALYEVETRVFNQAVKRNIKRFPADFMFQLTMEEWEDLRLEVETLERTMSSQFVMTYRSILFL